MTQTPEQKAARRAIKGVGPDTDLAGNPLTEEQKATMREIEARWAKEDAAKAHPLAALIDFNDARVQTVYQLLCDTEEPPEGEHWEGWTARRILAALEAAPVPDLVEAGKVLEGVTPGPWWTEPEGTIRNYSDGTPRWDLPRFVRYDETGHTVCKTHLIGGVDPDPALANARFIAWCREGVPALIALARSQAAQIAGLEAERRRATNEAETLRHYRKSHIDAEERLAAAEAEAANLRAEVERLRGVLRRWELNGCPDCRGDCASANPPVSMCIMRDTRAALEGKA